MASNNFGGRGGAPYLPPPPGHHRPPPPQYPSSSGYNPGYGPPQQQQQQQQPQHPSPAQSYSLPPLPSRNNAAPQPYQQQPYQQQPYQQQQPPSYQQPPQQSAAFQPAPSTVFFSCLKNVKVNDALVVLQALQASGLSVAEAMEELERKASPTGSKTVVVTEEYEDEIVVERTRKNYQPGLFFGGAAPTGGGAPVTKSNSNTRPGGPPVTSSNSSPAMQLPIPKLPPKASVAHHPPRTQPNATSRYEEEGSKFTPHAQSELVAMLTEEKFIYHHVKGAVGYIAPVGMGGIRYVDECFEFNEDGTYLFEKFTGSEGHEESSRLLLRWRGTYTVDAKRTVTLRWDTYDMNVDTTYSGQEIKELSTLYSRLVVGVDRTLRSPTDPNAIFV